VLHNWFPSQQGFDPLGNWGIFHIGDDKPGATTRTTTVAVNLEHSRFQPVITPVGPQGWFGNPLNVPMNVDVNLGYVNLFNNGIVEAYGELNSHGYDGAEYSGPRRNDMGQINGFLVIAGDLDVNMYERKVGAGLSQNNFVNNAIFTDWRFFYLPQDDWTPGNWEIEQGVVGAFFNWGARKQARINDGYLAAMRMHNSQAVWNSVRDRMISGDDNCRFFRGQICDPCGPLGRGFCDPCDAVACDPCDPCGYSNGCDDGCCTRGGRIGGLFGGYNGGNGTRDIWVNYTGRSNRYESALHAQEWRTNREWRISMEGVQVGLDLFKNRRSQFGMMFGYEGGKAVNANRVGLFADRVDTDDHYVGFYGARVLRSGADVRMAAGFGWQKYDMVRYGTRAWEQFGLSHAYDSAFKGRTTDFNLEIGKRFSSGAWSLRPAMALDYSKNKLRGATETADQDTVLDFLRGDIDERVRYGKTAYAETFLRFGTDLRFQARSLTVNSGIYYAYDVNDDRLYTRVTSVRHGLNPGLAGGNLGRGLVLFNVGGEFQVARNFGIFLGYDGQYRTEGTKTAQNTGYVGGVVKF